MNPQWRSLPRTLLLLHLSLVTILPSLPLSSAVDHAQLFDTCSKKISIRCGGENYNISYPFIFEPERPGACGRPGYNLTCVQDSVLMLQADDDKKYKVLQIDYSNRSLTIVDPIFEVPCSSSSRLTGTADLNSTLFSFSQIVEEISVFNCTSVVSDLGQLSDTCMSYYLYYLQGNMSNSDPNCEVAYVWMDQDVLQILQSSSISLWKALGENFTVTWTAESGKACHGCAQRDGVCTYDVTSGREECVCSSGLCPGVKGKNKTTAIAAGVSVGGVVIIAIFIGLLLLYRNRKRKLLSSNILLSRNISTEPSSAKEDPEFGTFSELGSVSRYRTQIFTFEELQEATNDFSASNELGDGGFGTVYKGVLRDGRVVAVKQLYQQNYRRLEQFMNEVDILSDLRHPNLVILYGCTSRHSGHLLLVYEYISNGTVADHLYGVLADAGFMAWPTRMSIAIETADALRYLHDDGTQIIHRDVKTNNILLDDNFRVKVADFGLSRLFPLNATHVSTAPQGTPGYVDPEYHQCYQLTDKSDVYSFGVVLAELISSKPAVDITRQRSEINLASMAVKKIQNGELEQFMDPRLGYQSDSRTREMIDSVAELAFRCLQLEKEMRPTMKEVVEELRRISKGRFKEERGTFEAEVEAKEEVHLLKSPSVHSPNSVTERWASIATTPNASG